MLAAVGLVALTAGAQEARPTNHAGIDSYCVRVHGSDSVAMHNCRQEEKKNLEKRIVDCAQSANKLQLRADEHKSFIARCMGASSDQALVADNIEAQVERGSLSYALATSLLSQGKLSPAQITKLAEKKILPGMPCAADTRQFGGWRALDTLDQQDGVQVIHPERVSHMFWTGDCRQGRAEGRGTLAVDGEFRPSGWVTKAASGVVAFRGNMRDGRFDGAITLDALPPTHPFRDFINDYKTNHFAEGRNQGLVRDSTMLAVQCHQQTSRYTDNRDGTFTDNSDRTWLRCPLGSTLRDDTCVGEPNRYDWGGMLRAVREFRFAGQSDWRLPTRNEFRSLGFGQRCSHQGHRLLFGQSHDDVLLADQFDGMTTLRTQRLDGEDGWREYEPDKSLGVILVRGGVVPPAAAAVPQSEARWRQGVVIRQRQLAEGRREREEQAARASVREARRQANNCAALRSACEAQCEGLSNQDGTGFFGGRSSSGSSRARCMDRCGFADSQCGD